VVDDVDLVSTFFCGLDDSFVRIKILISAHKSEFHN
jgi:hypothetical protein